ncbi:TetR/AcrR family transcriptional regulator [Rathayibacter sp. SD072]|uniref:TetR/AcrR family transcriptional regulator n=1 Tax=Rathayibacter sp. SD072 TaxID=2781731 RepID=UPI001F611A56|nr:TetR/AcrR family transcriptional regulator [Rathayibacter sp. SD072]
MDIGSESVASSPSRLRRWRHLRDAAVSLFAAKGYAEVSVDDIAAAAGVSRRTYFNYFATKSAVLFDPDPEEATRLVALLTQQPEAAELWVTLTEALTTYLDSQRSVVTLRRRILAADPELESLHNVANAEFERSLLNWLTEHHVDDFRAHLASGIALAVVREAFRWWDPEQDFAAFRAQLALGFQLAESGAGSALTTKG